MLLPVVFYKFHEYFLELNVRLFYRGHLFILPPVVIPAGIGRAMITGKHLHEIVF